jgi:hypothetical protein
MRRLACLWLLVGMVPLFPSGVRAQDGAFVVDSAGVEVVVNGAPSWKNGSAWSLSPTPLATMGGAHAAEGQDLWHIGGYVRTQDGLLAVLSAGHSEVREFDENGRFVRSFGRAGDGPGEFSLYPPNGSIAYVPPDTLIVQDGGGIDVFLVDGSVVEARRLDLQPGVLGAGTQVMPMVVLPDRSFLAVVHRFEAGFSPPSGAFRPEEGLAVIPGPGEAPVLLGWYGGLEQQMIPAGQGRMPLVTPFARRPVAATGPSASARFFIADTDRYEIQVFNADGKLVRIVRREYDPVRVKRAWVDAWKKVQRRQSWRGQLPALERAWRDMEVPATLPAIEALALDSEGFLWVLRPNGVSSADWSYDVFDPRGRLLGSVTAPSGLVHHTGQRPLIEKDRFVGVWIDDFGVESLRVYGLERHR